MRRRMLRTAFGYRIVHSESERLEPSPDQLGALYIRIARRIHSRDAQNVACEVHHLVRSGIDHRHQLIDVFDALSCWQHAYDLILAQWVIGVLTFRPATPCMGTPSNAATVGPTSTILTPSRSSHGQTPAPDRIIAGRSSGISGL